MKIKLEVEIDTKQDMDEINQVIEIVSEFRDKLIALQEDDFDEGDCKGTFVGIDRENFQQ